MNYRIINKNEDENQKTQKDIRNKVEDVITSNENVKK